MRVLCLTGFFHDGGQLHLARGLISEADEDRFARVNRPTDRVVIVEAIGERGNLIARTAVPASAVCSPSNQPKRASVERLLMAGMVPMSEGLHVLRFIWHGRQMHELVRPRSAPQVVLDWSPPAEFVCGPQPVTWMAAHSEGLPMTYYLFLGRGGCASRPLFVGDDTHAELDFDRLPSGFDLQLFVLASDGFYNAVARSPVFGIRPHHPRVVVSHPNDGAQVAADQPLLLEGFAWSRDAEMIFDDRLSWVSNIDGALGFGRSIRVNLSQGTHVLTLIAVGVGPGRTPISGELRVTVGGKGSKS